MTKTEFLTMLTGLEGALTNMVTGLQAVAAKLTEDIDAIDGGPDPTEVLENQQEVVDDLVDNLAGVIEIITDAKVELKE